MSQGLSPIHLYLWDSTHLVWWTFVDMIWLMGEQTSSIFVNLSRCRSHWSLILGPTPPSMLTPAQQSVCWASCLSGTWCYGGKHNKAGKDVPLPMLTFPPAHALERDGTRPPGRLIYKFQDSKPPLRQRNNPPKNLNLFLQEDSVQRKNLQ